MQLSVLAIASDLTLARNGRELLGYDLEIRQRSAVRGKVYVATATEMLPHGY